MDFVSYTFYFILIGAWEHDGWIGPRGLGGDRSTPWASFNVRHGSVHVPGVGSGNVHAQARTALLQLKSALITALSQ